MIRSKATMAVECIATVWLRGLPVFFVITLRSLDVVPVRDVTFRVSRLFATHGHVSSMTSMQQGALQCSNESPLQREGIFLQFPNDLFLVVILQQVHIWWLFLGVTFLTPNYQAFQYQLGPFHPFYPVGPRPRSEGTLPPPALVHCVVSNQYEPLVKSSS